MFLRQRRWVVQNVIKKHQNASQVLLGETLETGATQDGHRRVVLYPTQFLPDAGEQGVSRIVGGEVADTPRKALV